MSGAFLALLLLPFAVITGVLWLLRRDLLELRGTSPGFVLVALAMIPVVLLVEYLVHAAAILKRTGAFPRGFTLQPFWQGRMSPFAHVLLALIVIGEEIIYRQVWFNVLESHGLAPLAALAVCSVVYGLNHQFFGPVSVAAKTLSGALYGGLYLIGGRSLWLPILTHGLQNSALLLFTKDRDA